MSNQIAKNKEKTSMTTIKVVHILVCLLLIQFQQSSSEIIQPQSKEVPNEVIICSILLWRDHKGWQHAMIEKKLAN